MKQLIEGYSDYSDCTIFYMSHRAISTEMDPLQVPPCVITVCHGTKIQTETLIASAEQAVRY
jgi:hypothetical protein